MHRFSWSTLAWVLAAGTVLVTGCPKMKKRKEYNKMLWTAEVNENIERLYQALAAHHRRANLLVHAALALPPQSAPPGLAGELRELLAVIGRNRARLERGEGRR